MIVRIVLAVLFVGFLVAEYPNYPIVSNLTGSAVSLAVPLFGIPTTQHENFLLVEYPVLARTFSLSAECAGVILLSIFIFSLFITPDISMKNRLIGLTFLPLLFFGNVLRIATDILIGRFLETKWIILVHDTIGQVFLFFWAVATFYLYLRFTGQFPSERETNQKFNTFLDSK